MQASSANCTAPVFSLIKRVNKTDLLMPPFKRLFEPIFVPWQEKWDVGFFRGSPFCPLNGPHALNGSVILPKANCSRESLPLLSEQYPKILNVSVLYSFRNMQAPDLPLVSHDEHAQYK